MKTNYARYLIGVQYKGPRFNGWNSSLDAKLPSVSKTLKIAIRFIILYYLLNLVYFTFIYSVNLSEREILIILEVELLKYPLF
jgi:hypothetical protein